MKLRLWSRAAGTLAISTALLSSCAMTPRAELYGDPAPLAAATRTIMISDATALVTVKDYETIKFMVGDKSFAWRFDPAPRLGSLYLNWVAPPNLLNHDVTVIVATDPEKTQR